jgi:hypothetical protein
MYYRIAIQSPSSKAWQWKSTALDSLNSLVQWLQFHRALPRNRLRVFSASSCDELIEQLARENRGALFASVPATYYLPEGGGIPPSVVSDFMIRSIPRALEHGAAAHAAEYPALEADFTPDEIARLVALHQQARGHLDRGDADAAMRRLEFARWLVEHGKLNEGWAPDDAHAIQPCWRLRMLAC